MGPADCGRGDYRALGGFLESAPLWFQPWWLDACCGSDGWGAAIAWLPNDQPAAVLPYSISRRFRLRLLSQPRLTPALGPWFGPAPNGLRRDLSLTFRLLDQLIAGLPPHDIYRQCWLSSDVPWHPFYWAGFQQSTYYSYRLPAEKDPEIIWSQRLRKTLRRHIRLAKDRYGLTTRVGTAAELFACQVATFERQDLSCPFGFAYLDRLYTAIQAHGAGEVRVAVNESGALLAAESFVWDRSTTFGHLGGENVGGRAMGAAAMLIWNGIEAATARGHSFDFSGSMLPGIETFVRSFGGDLRPYFTVHGGSTRAGRLADLATPAIRNTRVGRRLRGL